MATAASLIVKLTAETAQFHQDMRAAADTMEQIGRRVQSAADLARTALTAFLGIQVGSSSFREFLDVTEQAEQAQNKLNAVLRASGDSVGFTARKIELYSETLANSSLFNRREITDAAAVLATFGNVSGDVFTKGLKLATDLSTVMGSDLHSAVVMIGKALNDPERGMTNLQRVGVQFSAAQKDIIRGFLQTNDLAGAQAYIIDALTKKFGGAGEAATEGLIGGIKGAKKAYDDFLESLGRTQQSSTVLGQLSEFFKQFFRNRELTTDPLQDLQITLDKAQSRIEDIKQQMKQGATGFVDDESGDVLSGSQAIARQQAIVTNTQARITAYNKLYDAQSRAAAAKGGSAGDSTTVDHTKAIQQEIAALTQEAFALEKGAKAALLKKLADEGATAADLQAAAAAFDRVQRDKDHNKSTEDNQRNTQAIQDQIDAMREQAATFNMTDEQIQIYEATLRGATQAQLDEMHALALTIQAERDYQQKLEARKQAEDKANKATEELTVHAFKNIQDSLASMLGSWASGTKSMGDLFQSFAQRVLDIWANLEAQLLTSQLFKLLGNAISSAGGAPSGPSTVSAPGTGPRGPGLDSVMAAAGPYVHQEVHFHIQAMDGPSVQSLLKRHGSTIAGIVLQSTRQSSSYRAALFRGG